MFNTNKKSLIIIFKILLLCLCIKEINASTMAYARVMVEVKDEKGCPVKDAEVMVAFSQPFVDDGEYGRMDYKTKTEMTNEKGTAVITGKSCKYMFCIVSKKGYYVSVVPNLYFKEIKNNKWQPWNKRIKVVLKKKVKPVPIYGRVSITLKENELDKELGYDLIAGDLVKPYGKGIVSDLIFKGHFDFKKNGNYRFKLIMTFPNKGDGIIEGMSVNKDGKSELEFSQYAPKKGYKKKFEMVEIVSSKRKKIYLSCNYNPQKYYFLRIRSKTKNGKVIKALYGKIIRDIFLIYEFKHIENEEIFEKSVSISFDYYINPKGTRKLKYDKFIFNTNGIDITKNINN